MHSTKVVTREISLVLLDGRVLFFLKYFSFATEVKRVLGMVDVWVSAAWILSIGSTVGCVVYGAMHWNYEDEE